jgi:aldehyde:ferredoxin oxidoreductase
MSRLLRVDMTTTTTKFEDVPEVYREWGGRGLTSMITAREVPPTCHPLGPNNKIVIAPGIVSGTAAPTSGRTSFGGKSPLTGGIKESNAGGLSSHQLARLGIKAIVIEGLPKDAGAWWLLKITKDGTEFVPAADLAGKGMYEVNRILWERYGKNVAVIGIGPAGEHRLTGSGICVNDGDNGATRYAGRGGLGAVMGSKGLKAIVVDPAGAPGVKVANEELFKAAIKKLTAASLSHDVTKKGGTLNTYGTAALINVLNEAGGLPTRNFRTGRFEYANNISGEALRELILKRGGIGKKGHGCHPGCIIQCGDVFPRPDGTYHVSTMEYESVWALGANCGIGNLDDIADLVWSCNDVGLDTIEMGCAIAVAMDGGYLRFGDAEGAKKLLNEEVRNGTPIGRIIGNGTEFTGKAFGVVRVPTVKSQAMPAYEPRAVKGIGVTYATTPMGADHTAGYTIATEILGVGGTADPLAAQAKAELSRAFQASTAFIDTSGYCLFDAFAVLDIPEGLQGMVESCAAVVGENWTTDDLMRLGIAVLETEREFNEAAGLTRAHDRIPEFMKYEPLPPHNTVFDVSDEDLDRVHTP